MQYVFSYLYSAVVIIVFGTIIALNNFLKS